MIKKLELIKILLNVNLTLQYIDQHTTTKTNIQRQNDPTHTRTRMANHNRYAVHNHNSKDLEYDLTSQKRTSLN